MSRLRAQTIYRVARVEPIMCRLFAAYGEGLPLAPWHCTCFVLKIILRTKYAHEFDLISLVYGASPEFIAPDPLA